MTSEPQNSLVLERVGDEAVELRTSGGGLLLRYVVQPRTPGNESPRPYAHPVQTLGGALLTNFRPNDHPWHHGLSLTIGSLAGRNFWGGPTYRRSDGYQWRDDHGTQVHKQWIECSATNLAHFIEWLAGDEVLLLETRVLTPKLKGEKAWSLRWRSELRNVSGRELQLGNYHSREGLQGSHYTGLQFRGARDLLDRHGDAQIGVFAPTGENGEAALNGFATDSIEWRGQKDTSLNRVRLRFENRDGPLRWFVREGNPLVSFAFQFDLDHTLPPNGILRLDHALTFQDE